MKKKNQSIAYIVSGIFLSTIFLLITIWYYVKINQIENELVRWGIWLLLSAPLIFTGIYKLTDKKIHSVLLTIIILFALAVFNVYLMFTFYALIGGTK